MFRDVVQVRVSDRGPGIPPEERERVFEAFYRGGRSPEMPGSGLGLAIAKAIVTAHGGRIWVEGRSGRWRGRGVRDPDRLVRWAT